MNIYVDFLNGNDANPGTELQPVKTISFALTVVGVDDFVLLHDNADHVVTGALVLGASRRIRPYGGGYSTVDLSAGSLDADNSILFERIAFDTGNVDISSSGSYVFRNCLFMGSEITVSGAAPIVRIDNCIADSIATFLDVTGSLSSQSRLKNCIFDTVTVMAAGSAITMSYSCRFNSTLGTVVLGAGNIEDDPEFGGPGNGDYRLLVGSPCIDTGDPLVEDGSRPPAMGEATSDMGAYGGPFNIEQNVSNEYFVDSLSGLDIQLGTLNDPLKTIAEAVSRVPSGGRITLRGSHTYVLSSPIANLDAYLSMYSEDSEKPTVQGESISIDFNTVDIDSIGFEDIIFLTDSVLKKSIILKTTGNQNIGELEIAKRCIFRGLIDSDDAGISIGTPGFSLSGTAKILNCTFDRSSTNLSEPCLQINGGSPFIEIINTVFSNMVSAVSAEDDYDPSNITFSYSWFYGNVENFTSNSSVSGVPNYDHTESTGSENPLYIDEITVDYKLQAVEIGYLQDSPLIDAGIALFFDEQDGDQRGTIRADIGAYGGTLTSNPIPVDNPLKSAETRSYRYRDLYDTLIKSFGKLKETPSYIPEGQELVQWVDDAVRHIGIKYCKTRKTEIFTSNASRYVPIASDDVHGVEHVFVPFDEALNASCVLSGCRLNKYDGRVRNEYFRYDQYLRRDLSGPVESITLGTTTVIISTDHNLIDGDYVRYSDIVGARASGEIHRMNGEAWPVTWIDENSYSIPLDSSTFDKWDSGGRWRQCTYVLDFKLEMAAGTRYEVVYETIPMQRVSEESIVDLPSGMWTAVVDRVIAQAYDLSGNPQFGSGYKGKSDSKANDNKLAEAKRNRNNTKPRPINYPNPSRSGGRY